MVFGTGWREKLLIVWSALVKRTQRRLGPRFSAYIVRMPLRSTPLIIFSAQLLPLNPSSGLHGVICALASRYLHESASQNPRPSRQIPQWLPYAAVVSVRDTSLVLAPPAATYLNTLRVASKLIRGKRRH